MLGMHRRARVWNEFSEYLLETRVLTSSDFNTYPIQFFLHFDVIILCVQMIRTESFHIWTIQRSITEEFTAMVRVTRHILSKGPTGEYNKEAENCTGYDKGNSNLFILISITNSISI